MAGMNTADVPTSAIAAKCATLFQNPDRQLCRDTVLDEVGKNSLRLWLLTLTAT